MDAALGVATPVGVPPLGLGEEGKIIDETTAPPLHTFGPPPAGEAHLTAGMPGASWQLPGRGEWWWWRAGFIIL